jgi:tRNA(adenine34) deaminase
MAFTAADDRWMARAAELADVARAAGNTAVGALVVRDGVVIAEAAETAPHDRPFGHAEFMAVEAALMTAGGPLHDATLYSTAEPCILCGFAVREAGIGRVVIGRKAGEIGSVDSRFPVLTDTAMARWDAPPEIHWYHG